MSLSRSMSRSMSFNAPARNESIASYDKENSQEVSRLDRTRAVVSKKLTKSKLNVSNYVPIEKIEYNKIKVEKVVEAK